MKTKLLVFSVLPLLGISPAGAATYYVDDATVAGTVIGTITTDGHVGVLGAADITGWNLRITDTAQSLSTVLNSNNSSIAYSQFGTALSATPTSLTFNYSSTAALNTILNFHETTGGGDYVEWASYNGIPGYPIGGYLFIGLSTSDSSYQSASLIRYGSETLATRGPLAVTPLPATWTMMLIGLAGFGVFACRRKNTTELNRAYQ